MFSVAIIARTITKSQRRDRVTVLYREKIDKKEMFLDVYEKQAENEMLGCQVAMSSIV